MKVSFHHVLIDGAVGKAVTAASDYLKSVEPTAGEESYDPKAGSARLAWRQALT
ncbi:hypothetical protein [Salinibacterium sp. ZJ450]|uniref:hypothetical protein n=1 Tax=Salinibacterium sp. ZJ450 TaxID=2708338 RepID=UPI001422380F|nr:hypothetical protein [Salinibacterium sp. ZJ450]